MKQIIDSVRPMKLKFLLHGISSARLCSTERKAHVVIRIGANLGFNDVSAGNPCSRRYVVANGCQKSYSLPIVFSFLTEV